MAKSRKKKGVKPAVTEAGKVFSSPSHTNTDINKLAEIKAMWERGYTVSDIARLMGTHHVTVGDIVKKHKWKRFSDVIAPEENATMELDIPEGQKLNTLQLVQLQNLSAVDYAFAIVKLSLQRLRSEVENSFRQKPVEGYAERMAGDEVEVEYVGRRGRPKRKSPIAEELTSVISALGKIVKPMTDLIDRRERIVSAMPDLLEEGDFEETLRGVLKEVQSVENKKRQEYQRSKIPDVAYDEKVRVNDKSVEDMMKQKLESAEKAKALRKKMRGGGMSAEIF